MKIEDCGECEALFLGNQLWQSQVRMTLIRSGESASLEEMRGLLEPYHEEDHEDSWDECDRRDYDGAPCGYPVHPVSKRCKVGHE
jgi:hypothetical protein